MVLEYNEKVIDMSTRINKALYKALKNLKDEYFFEGKVNKNKVIKDLEKHDRQLLGELLKSNILKENFTADVSGHLVVYVNKLIELLEMDEYWTSSYTKYSKKIGLTIKNKFLDEINDVVLDYPYKDTILKASMNKEEREIEKNLFREPFLNEVIAREEIDILLDKKILVNAKNYNQKGEYQALKFKDNDNLIIKGNNLLALHSIKDKFNNRVKFIYIDPPYNTGEDSFTYNDSFNLSAWLVFIKNRIEVAFELLKEDGVIAIQISNHQYHYLKVLLDNIFKDLGGKHVMTFNVLVRHPDRILTGDKEYNDVIEYTLIYSKSKDYKMPKEEVEKETTDYIYQIKTNNNPDEILIMGGKSVEVYYPKSYRVLKKEGSSKGLKTISVRGSIREKNSSGRFYVKYIEPLKEQYESETIFKIPEMGDDYLGHRYISLPKSGNKNGYYYQGLPLSSKVTLKPVPNFLDFKQAYNLVNEEGRYSYRNGKKPEKMLQYYIELFSKENDIVMDFFMGSGSTQAASLKMNRQFIGIEQMDHIKEIAIPRLKEVICGEQSGISQEVNWKGGGSFVYVELMEKNRGFLNSVQNAKTTVELQDVFTFMLEEAEIDFRVDLEKVKETLFEKSFNEQKETLIKIIDKNQLYFNYSEIDDENVRYFIEDNDYSFNKSFYSEGDE